jgi:hypothetical protein
MFAWGEEPTFSSARQDFFVAGRCVDSVFLVRAYTTLTSLSCADGQLLGGGIRLMGDRAVTKYLFPL